MRGWELPAVALASLSFRVIVSSGFAGSSSFFEGEVYIFCLINICSSLSDEGNKIKPLNIERA